MAQSSSYSEVHIINAYRTGIGAFYGQFNEFPAPMLGAATIKACRLDLQLHGKEICQVIMGQVLTGGLGSNPVGSAAAGAEIPANIPASTINMDCASGLQAVHLGFQAIKYGSSKIVICGGQENITMAPQSIHVPPGCHPVSGADLRTFMLVEGLTDSFTGLQMRERANNLAELHNISREMQDKYAYESIQKALIATRELCFNDETLIVRGFYKDEIVYGKFKTTLDMLKHMPPLQEGPGKPSTVSIGNSAELSDGAAALTLCSSQQLTILGRQSLAKIVDFVEVSLSPDQMGIGSVAAIEILLQKVNWAKEDVDLYEIQEVFAVQAIIVIDKLNIKPEKVNISGGAIAFGHPIGASSARMLITLIYNLRRLNLRKGVASVCTGKGKALAVAVERLQGKKI